MRLAAPSAAGPTRSQPPVGPPKQPLNSFQAASSSLKQPQAAPNSPQQPPTAPSYSEQNLTRTRQAPLSQTRKPANPQTRHAHRSQNAFRRPSTSSRSSSTVYCASFYCGFLSSLSSALFFPLKEKKKTFPLSLSSAPLQLPETSRSIHTKHTHGAAPSAACLNLFRHLLTISHGLPFFASLDSLFCLIYPSLFLLDLQVRRH